MRYTKLDKAYEKEIAIATENIKQRQKTKLTNKVIENNKINMGARKRYNRRINKRPIDEMLYEIHFWKNCNTKFVIKQPKVGKNRKKTICTFSDRQLGKVTLSKNNFHQILLCKSSILLF